MLNLVEILKNVPLGTELYCTVFGKVRLLRINIDPESIYPILIGNDKKSALVRLTKEGKWNDSYPGECILFPSESNRDWSTFKFQPQTFEPFQKVLVRNTKDNIWLPDLFGFYDGDSHFPFRCISGYYKYCIPYCEELLGTSKGYKL